MRACQIMPVRKFNKAIRALGYLLFPWPCRLCGSSQAQHSGICLLCRDYLPWRTHGCVICGLPVAVQEDHQWLCGQCQKARPRFDSLEAPFWYQAPISQLITDYKYAHCWHNAQTLAELMADFLQTRSLQGLIVPVPSHPRRIRERGFNAVNELVKLVSKKTVIRYDFNLVCRHIHTQTQTGKNKYQRRNNVKNAFKVRKPVMQDHVIIFDEVVTTGATVNELSACLKKAGVKKITVLTVARTKQVTNSWQ